MCAATIDTCQQHIIGLFVMKLSSCGACAGKPHGRGLHKGGDGSLSVGLYVDGFREGLAAHDLPNGDRYVGAPVLPHCRVVVLTAWLEGG